MTISKKSKYVLTVRAMIYSLIHTHTHTHTHTHIHTWFACQLQLAKSGASHTSKGGRRNARGQSAAAVAPSASVSGSICDRLNCCGQMAGEAVYVPLCNNPDPNSNCEPCPT